MYMQAEFEERCRGRGLDEKAIAGAVGVVLDFVRFVRTDVDAPLCIDAAGLDMAMAGLSADGTCDENTIMAVARYCSVTGNGAAAIRALAYLLPVGVLPAMLDRVGQLRGQGVADRIAGKVSIPAAGTPPEAYPEATASFVGALVEEVGTEQAYEILAWNVHGIPAAAFDDDARSLAVAASVDVWLAERHQRLLTELREHADKGTLWYEQKITQEVVDWLAGHQEVQTGVRVGNDILITKIPYDPDAWLRETDVARRRHLACHCPLARSTLLKKAGDLATADGPAAGGPVIGGGYGTDSQAGTASQPGTGSQPESGSQPVSDNQPGTDNWPEAGTGVRVPALWCACSAGYTKFRFDVVFGQETKARVVSSVLAGDDVCRFAVRIPDRWLPAVQSDTVIQDPVAPAFA